VQIRKSDKSYSRHIKFELSTTLLPCHIVHLLGIFVIFRLCLVKETHKFLTTSKTFRFIISSYVNHRLR